MDLRSAAMGVIFALLWASAFTLAKVGVRYAPPFALLSVRFVITGVLAVGIAAALGQSARLNTRQWRAVVLFGVAQNAVYLGLNFVALQRIEATVAVIVASALPLGVAAASFVFLGERLRPLGLFGLVAGFGGVILIMGARVSGGADLIGIGLCVLAVMALTVATLTVRGASSGGNLLMVVGLQMLVGAAVLLPISLVTETWVFEPAWQLFAALAYLVVFPGLLATLIWFLLVGRIGATRAATYHFLNPFFGVATAAILLSETMSLRDIAGVGVIMTAILMVQLSRQRSR